MKQWRTQWNFMERREDKKEGEEREESGRRGGEEWGREVGDWTQIAKLCVRYCWGGEAQNFETDPQLLDAHLIILPYFSTVEEALLFHDVDVCRWQYSMSYGGQFGGVITIRPHMFRRINGFPIVYFGWGGEDDDMGSR